ncbi:Pentatricopeptide repeat-containing protein, partial [Thalictrum thalictroides]
MELFHQMRTCGPAPNDVTFIAILSACAHAGLVREGREVLTFMKQHYKIVPRVEHHAIWTAMLGACKMHKNYDLG